MLIFPFTSESLTLKKKTIFSLVFAFPRSQGGYYGSYLNDGLGGGLLLQAAQLLRSRLPRTLGKETLSQVWAYKYDAAAKQGIRVHVDQVGLLSLSPLSPFLALDLSPPF